MATHLHLDFETFSEVDIRDVGAYRYCADKSTEVLCCAFSMGEEDPVVWHPDMDEVDLMGVEPYFQALRDPSVPIVAHNCMFEFAVLQYHCMKIWGIPCPDVYRFRCTMSLARRAALPAKLETLAETLNLPHKKDSRGKALLRKFSMMQPAKKPTKKNPDGLPPHRIRPQDDPEAFKELLEYCAQDVRVEKLVEKKLSYFDDEINQKNYTLDAKINARGVPVNLKALRHAQKLIDEETEIVSRQFRELVGFEVTQNARLLEWVNQQGYSFENLQAETIDTFLEEREKYETTDVVVQALKLKQSIAYASIKKVKTMLECAGPHDNRIRGMLNHHGATTGRWTHSLVQPGNFKRPTIKHSEQAYADICDGMDHGLMGAINGPILEVISSSIRHFIQDAPKQILDADYAAIEARIVNWLAGQEDALERFRAYDQAPAGSELKKSLDPYRIMASDVYGIPVAEIKPFPHRFIGKGLTLGAGFMLSWTGFQRQCLEQAKHEISDDDSKEAIEIWRGKHPKVVRWWRDLDNAGKSAILQRGKVFPAGKVSFCCKDIDGTVFLLMRLPSGRKLAYPRPRLVPGKFEGTTQIEYWGNIKGTTWGWCRLWPGAMANNATQGTANDVMFNGCHNCENAGYEIFSVIHDQSLAFIKPGQTSQRFAELLTDLPSWASGLPIAAEGGEVPFYRKD